MATSKEYTEILLQIQELKIQVGILVSRLESERETRRRRNTGVDEEIELVKGRIDKQESWHDKWSGALILLTIISILLGIVAVTLTVLNKK